MWCGESLGLMASVVKNIYFLSVSKNQKCFHGNYNVIKIFLNRYFKKFQSITFFGMYISLLLNDHALIEQNVVFVYLYINAIRLLTFIV